MKPFILACALLASAQASAAPARILLTFDDGPNESTTTAVLEELDKRNAKAVFFILTGPETLFEKRAFRRVYPKAETESGFQTVMNEIEQGHLIACRWGGAYGAQSNYHPPRLLEPAYDSTGDGVVDKTSDAGNALESDLIQCQQRLNQALSTVRSTTTGQEIQQPNTIAYVRPPGTSRKSERFYGASWREPPTSTRESDRAASSDSRRRLWNGSCHLRDGGHRWDQRAATLPR